MPRAGAKVRQRIGAVLRRQSDIPKGVHITASGNVEQLRPFPLLEFQRAVGIAGVPDLRRDVGIEDATGLAVRLSS